MFPYHDDNRTLRPALVTLLLIALNVAGVVFRGGRGLAAGGRAVGVRSRPHPGRPHRRAAPGRAVSSRGGLGVHRRSRFAGPARPHVDVPAWLVDAPARQHVVPLALREQHRGLDGRGRGSSSSTCSCGIAAALAQVVVTPASVVPMVGRVGRDQRRDGRVSGAVSRACACSASCPRSSSLPCRRGPCCSTGWAAVCRGLCRAGRRGGRRRRVLGARGGFVAGIILVKFFARTDYVEAHRAGTWTPRRVRTG